MRKLLRKILRALRSGVAVIGSGIDAASDVARETFERLMSLFAGRYSVPSGPRVREAQDVVADLVEEPSGVPVATVERTGDEVRELGATVRAVCQALLQDDDSWGAFLEPDVDVYLLARTKAELRRLIEASDEQIGLHVLGTPAVPGFGHGHLDLPDLRRDTAIVEHRVARRKAYEDGMVSKPEDVANGFAPEDVIDRPAPSPLPQ